MGVHFSDEQIELNDDIDEAGEDAGEDDPTVEQ